MEQTVWSARIRTSATTSTQYMTKMTITCTRETMERKLSQNALKYHRLCLRLLKPAQYASPILSSLAAQTTLMKSNQKQREHHSFKTSIKHVCRPLRCHSVLALLKYWLKYTWTYVHKTAV